MTNLLFVKDIAEKCMKMREFGRRRGDGAYPQHFLGSTTEFPPSVDFTFHIFVMDTK